MVLGIAEDYTTKDLVLDSELTGTPSSGLYLNRGVHPAITLGNLLAFLPLIDINFDTWNISTAYQPYSITQNRGSVVIYQNKIYECIATSTGNNPSTSSAQWLETTIESLRLKSFIRSVEDRVKTELQLNKRLVNNQYIYEDGDYGYTPPQDYSGWAIERRGSDYVTVRINKIAITKMGTTPVNFYIVNQGTLLETFQVSPSNGRTVFVDVDKTLSGNGPFYILVDNEEVLVGDNYMDVLRYNHFNAYPVIGQGTSPEDADISQVSRGMGIGLNLSAYADGSAYLDDNISEYGNFIRATLEYMAFLTYYHNANNRSNRSEAIRMNDAMLMAEVRDVHSDTIISRFYRERKLAKKVLDRTLDLALKEGSVDNDSLYIDTGSL